MRNVICAAVALTMSVQAGAQQKITDSPDQAAWTSTGGLMEFNGCAMSQQGGEPVLSATIVTAAGPGGGPHIKRSAANAVSADGLDGGQTSLDFSWGQSNGGGASSQSGPGLIVPTVTAHAIKTKGAGGMDRSASQACAAPPLGQRLLLPAVQRREAKPVLSCDISGDPSMPTVTIQIPMSAFGPNARTGHVTLNRRQASVPSVSERASRGTSEGSVVACAANARGGPTYDLAVGKKV